jgi:hypothetical protein
MAIAAERKATNGKGEKDGDDDDHSDEIESDEGKEHQRKHGTLKGLVLNLLSKTSRRVER